MDSTALLVRIESDAGRAALLERAERDLPEGESLVRIVDVIGVRRSVRTQPVDPRATCIAQEVPVLLRGGLTSIVSYWSVPSGQLAAVERHFVGKSLSHEYRTTLSVARVGTRSERRAVPA